MGNFRKVSSGEIEKVLANTTRQYFVGNLKKPQELPFVQDDRLEMGVTDYTEYTTEKVHYHTETLEYIYLISGWTKYMDVETGEVQEYRAGDFYCIETDTVYAQKSAPGTRLIFVKVPSKNDKQEVETSELVREWYEKGMEK